MGEHFQNEIKIFVHHIMVTTQKKIKKNSNKGETHYENLN